LIFVSYLGAMKNLNLNIRLTEAEFLKFSLQRFYQSLVGKIITIFGLFLIVVPILLFLIKPEFVNGKFPFPQFILGIVFTIGVPLLIFRASKKAYFANNQLSEETTYTFENEVINLQGSSYTLKLKWDRLVQVTETDAFFLLYVTRQSSHIIPKAQLSEKEESHLRELIKSIPDLTHKLFE
jgi:hypothetical protein